MLHILGSKTLIDIPHQITIIQKATTSSSLSSALRPYPLVPGTSETTAADKYGSAKLMIKTVPFITLYNFHQPLILF